MAVLSDRAVELAPRGWTVYVRSAAPYAVGALLAAGAHFAFGSIDAPFAAKLAVDVAIAIVAAASLTIVNGFAGQFSIGHAGFMAIGGYVSAAITYYGSIKIFGDAQMHGGVLSWGLPLEFFSGGIFGWGDLLFVGACLTGGLAAAIAGFAVGMPSLRLRGDYLAIVTLGFGEIVRVLLQSADDQITSVETVKESSFWTLSGSLGRAVGMNFLPQYTTLFWSWLAVAVTLIVAYRVKTGSVGRALLSIREDEIAAEAMGVRTTRSKVYAFVLSSFFAGIAGALFAHQIGSINAGEFGFARSFEVIIIIVLGGLGSLSGAALAAIVLTLLPEALRDFSQYRMIAYALALVIAMILRPQGLFGLREIWQVPWFRRLFRLDKEAT